MKFKLHLKWEYIEKGKKLREKFSENGTQTFLTWVRNVYADIQKYLQTNIFVRERESIWVT